ncbi:hypothetical protein H257_01106 [Aphanomyces astaci]|uniref:Uncharacterized protein n=1 Tax=Aphanomyces astaci TaxID=112090 RepID=W4H6F1_APHAT|nr:hypothetical protein H257_01106 [Aphanomyces astaci]ETV87580.1 hypothetical protein H257_01106 [Aphanomyces astaci]|eukprot:XP_009822443.1 hypothetical protein H257_01106 [Aphanomyces astaci]
MPKQFTIVYIPADEGTELQEWHLDLPQDVDGQIACLTERLRAHFKGKTGAASTDEQKDAFRQQIIKQLPKDAPVNDQMMAMMLQMESLVDSIPLILNTPAVKYVGVNLYVDDKGTAKNLPVNLRASAIAQACGKMLEVRGDAFIARLFDNGASGVSTECCRSHIVLKSCILVHRRCVCAPGLHPVGNQRRCGMDQDRATSVVRQLPKRVVRGSIGATMRVPVVLIQRCPPMFAMPGRVLLQSSVSKVALAGA